MSGAVFGRIHLRRRLHLCYRAATSRFSALNVEVSDRHRAASFACRAKTWLREAWCSKSDLKVRGSRLLDRSGTCQLRESNLRASDRPEIRKRQVVVEFHGSKCIGSYKAIAQLGSFRAVVAACMTFDCLSVTPTEKSTRTVFAQNEPGDNIGPAYTSECGVANCHTVPASSGSMTLAQRKGAKSVEAG